MTTNKPPRTCSWFVSEDQPECGEPATSKVKVRGKITQATIDVCPKHKAEHDENFAKLRTSGTKR